MSLTNSHGSESSSKLVRACELALNKGNRSQWAIELKAALAANGRESAGIPGWNKPLSLIEARKFDCEKQIETKIQMLNILAGMVESEAGGNATGTFEERVKIVQAQRTPTKRAGETNETMAAREERESAEVAFAKAMSVLTPEQREVFARATHFLDPMTGRIETKAEREQRMACWSKFAMPSLRSHHQELASNVMEGDFAALIGKVM